MNGFNAGAPDWVEAKSRGNNAGTFGSDPVTGMVVACPENNDKGVMSLTVGAVAALMVIVVLAELDPAHVVTVNVAVAVVRGPTVGALYTGLAMAGLDKVPKVTVHENAVTGSGAVAVPLRVIDPPEGTV